MKKSIQKIFSNAVPATQEPAIKAGSPWWVILLRILSYIISLVLGGVVTSCAPNML